MSETITNAHHIPKDVGGGIFKYKFFVRQTIIKNRDTPYISGQVVV